MHPCIHASMHPCIHACMHTYIHTHRHTDTHTHIHTYTDTQIHRYTDTHIRIYAYTHTYTYNYMHTIFIIIYTLYKILNKHVPYVSIYDAKVETVITGNKFCTNKILQHNIRGSSKAKTAVRILNGALINKAG